EVTPTFPITSSNVDPALDRPMILLQALLRYGPGRCRRFSSRAPLAWSSSDCERISGMFAGVDEPRGGKGLFLPRLWPEIVGPPRRPDWSRAKNRSSRRWSQEPGTSTAICLSLAHGPPRF